MTYEAARTRGAPDAPLIFTFHGTGGDENQFHGLASQLVPGAHVISPRGDVSEAGMNRYFKRTGEGVYDMEDLAERTERMADFLAREKRSAGAGRAIGLGYSNGANILASVAFGYPGIVDDMILMHPLIPWTPEAQPGLEGRRILITAGRRDPICPAPMTEALIDYFADQNVDLEIAWHDGGHEIRQEELSAIQAFLG